MIALSVFPLLGSCIGIGFGAIGSAIGVGQIAKQAVNALGRQPTASGKIIRIMIIGQAITETAAIFALVISLLLLFRETPENMTAAISSLAAGIAIGFGTIGSGIGAGLAGSACMDGIGKNPENTDVLTINMIIGQAVTQTSCIFALTISLVLLTQTADVETVKLFALLGGGCAMGFGAMGPGIGDGLVAKNANGAIAVDPQHAGLLTRTMIIGQAVTETTDIYAMIIALILIFVV